MKDFLQKDPKPPGRNQSNSTLSTSDYYSAPTSAPFAADSLGRGNYNDSRWYSLDGRVGRVRFLSISMIWGLLAFLVVFVLMFLLGIFGSSDSGVNGSSMILVYILIIPMYIYTSFLLPRRRLHDLDRSGWLVLLAFIPFINLLFYLYVIFARGDEGINRFGLPPAPYTRGELWLAILPLIFIVIAIVAAIMMPSYYQDALLENQASLEEMEAQLEAQNAEAGSDYSSDNRSVNNTETSTIETNSAPTAVDSVENLDNTVTIIPSNTAESSGSLTYEEFISVSETPLYHDPDPQ